MLTILLRCCYIGKCDVAVEYLGIWRCPHLQCHAANQSRYNQAEGNAQHSKQPTPTQHAITLVAWEQHWEKRDIRRLWVATGNTDSRGDLLYRAGLLGSPPLQKLAAMAVRSPPLMFGLLRSSHASPAS